MKKFFVAFCIPAAAVADWMKNVSEEERKKQTAEMMGSWHKWMEVHKSVFADGQGFPLGKTKRVTKEGIADVKNDLNWYVVVKADSHEAAVDLFKDHPQVIDIPSAYIEVVEIPERPGMM